NRNTLTTSPLSSKVDSGDIYTYEMERIDIVLNKASILETNISTVSKAKSPLFNLYINDAHSSVESQELQSEILIKNVYAGIDWKVYIKEESGNTPILKYDFIVHPGADVSQIELEYSKNAKLELKENEIRSKTKMAQLNEEQPFSYLKEDNTEIPVSYKLN